MNPITLRYLRIDVAKNPSVVDDRVHTALRHQVEVCIEAIEELSDLVACAYKEDGGLAAWDGKLKLVKEALLADPDKHMAAIESFEGD